MEKSGKKVSIWSSIKDFVYDLFNRGIPSDEVQAMHESWRVPIAAVIYSSFVAMFIAFLVTGYQKYIVVRSLSYAPYTSHQAYTQFVPEGCDAIPISVTGDYYASDDGYWSGSSSNFDYSSGIYQFSMSSFSNQDNLYTYLMQVITVTHLLTHSPNHLLTHSGPAASLYYQRRNRQAVQFGV